MSYYFETHTMDDLLNEIEHVYLSDKRPWVIGYSGGKDSTVVVHLVYSMLKRLKPASRHKQVHIVSSDTLVENPVIKEYLLKMLRQLEQAVEAEQRISGNFPLLVKHVTPEPEHSFWANVIGRGFPTPRLNGSFRWCTDRLKIAPSGKYIETIIKEQHTEVVVLLGVRKEESSARKRRIEGREIQGRLLNRHETIKQAFVYPPIVGLATDDIWDILAANNYQNAWGGSNTTLIELYQDGDGGGGECPFAGFSSKDEQQQSCGQSRFGCWVCTVVEEDKSLNGFIRAGRRELMGLAKFRKWLIEIRDEPDNREKKRRDGTIYVTKNNKEGLGPFTWRMRKEILTRLLTLQKEMNYELITVDELKAIDQIWDEELDISRCTLVNLYYKVMGEKLPWHDLKSPLYDDLIIKALEDYAREFEVPFELIRNMILVTNKNKFFSNPQILRKSLSQTVVQDWLHREVLEEYQQHEN